ncbi:hypothetical protein TBLA_0C03000 [Henningerozyma blattae CBS 6284]|uniref:Rab-GAP TBC domain-containing protein n=1 Tax=Henningerozyma blattae (strain ATCC 34711 / CBS 6284 / DSM 70876 / NBRC 10599 / NRRL Y-10934 / UCD 77-7) TaxID=1071380 RepID=I2H152_HENB6|nr:hypothetical protein TBLA_0C03000 [Tetrapisispora blattae CBS 6284]CCH60104.1 hypothetical protein TBLA_0C03000 [Tetrapisispora blattae CBS 6284]
MDQSIKQSIIEKYKTKDQLIQQGIWKGEIYNYKYKNLSFNNLSIRGWIWKTIILNIDNNSDNYFYDSNNIDILLLNDKFNNDDFFRVPIIDSNEDNKSSGGCGTKNSDEEDSDIQSLQITNNSCASAKKSKNVGRVRSLIKKRNLTNIRRLTPKETPLGFDNQNLDDGDVENRQSSNRSIGFEKKSPQKNQHHHRHTRSIDSTMHNGENVEEEDDDYEVEMSLKETLEIIDLDLSRLLLDPIFLDDNIHVQMRQLLYNYIVLLRNGDFSWQDKSSSSGAFPLDNPLENFKSKNYQQGYHEILGLIYLQVYKTSVDHGSGNLSSTTELGLSKLEMRNVFEIYIKLMEQIKPIFYERKRLIRWERTQFQNILQNCNEVVYSKLYPAITNVSNKSGAKNTKTGNYSNLIWLVRWTRLIFLRELPREDVLIIWDHILTFQYPIEIFMACLIILLLLLKFNKISQIDPIVDNDEILELMLHYKLNETEGDGSTKKESAINCIELCKIAGNLSELWYYEKYDDMKCICDTFLKIQMGVEMSQYRKEEKAIQELEKSQIKTHLKVDPNRLRLEERLRSRVHERLNK